jgi:transcriptional regulator with XRE-family HTH domain
MRYDAKKILDRRIELDLTQAEVSTRSRITIGTISNIENGHKEYLKPDTMEALAKALRCEPDALCK